MPILKTDGTVITERVETALSRPEVVKVKKRTLGGKWYVQTIGTGSTVVDVTAHFTKAEKLIFDALEREGSEFKVIFDGRWYTGPIDDEIEYERIRSSTGARFSGEFVLLVNEEGAV